MPDNHIGLNEIVVAYVCVGGNGGEGSYHTAFSEADIGSDACRVVDKGEEFPAPLNDTLHTRTARRSADGADKDVAGLRQVVRNGGQHGGIALESIQGMCIVVDIAFDVEISAITYTLACHVEHGAPHAACAYDNQMFHCALNWAAKLQKMF